MNDLLPYKTVFKYESFWVLVSSGLTVILMLIVFGNGAFSTHMDFNFYGTTVSIPGMNIFVNVFLLINFLVFLVKNKLPQFRSTWGNWILIVTGLLLLIFLDANIGLLKPVTSAGWVVYPPMSNVGPTSNAEIFLMFIATILRLVQFATVIMLLVFVYQWGKGNRV